ncbi:MAG TPA: molecular chaperone [Planctomycetaceae bacterium]|nr:molecular chaperone [Planctomycetaceae bacterium]
MNLIPWKNKSVEEAARGVGPMSTLRADMDRLFENFVREPFGAIDWPFGGAAGWSPAVDLAETDAEYTVRAELPGLEPGDLDISVTENRLMLSGEKKEKTERTEKGVYHSESRYGSFCRSIPLPGAIDSSNVNAEFKNGVLTVHLAKSPENTPKRIEVKVAEG